MIKRNINIWYILVRYLFSYGTSPQIVKSIFRTWGLYSSTAKIGYAAYISVLKQAWLTCQKSIVIVEIIGVTIIGVTIVGRGTGRSFYNSYHTQQHYIHNISITIAQKNCVYMSLRLYNINNCNFSKKIPLSNKTQNCA